MSRTTDNSFRNAALAASAAWLLAGCGGGDSAATPPAGSPGVAQRAAAVKATAESASNACRPIRPFYWEIGDATAALASGSTDAAGGMPTYTAATTMPIASATKWLYGAYVAEKRSGSLSASDIRFLHFRSGYVSFDAFGSCTASMTVDGCLNAGRNGDYTASSDGKFHYDGGHMQKHASLDGLGALDAAALAAELRSRLGNDIGLAFSAPQLGGGAVTTAADYARFLRKLLGGQLRLGSQLGAHAVCADPATCADALYSPSPAGERWQYAIGHWVDADPVVGDGAFSSTGAFGFHPWIDARRISYGVIARRALLANAGVASVACGRLLRRAWASGTAQ